MEFKRPETFEDILNLQKHLDESIHSSRERTLKDIKLSLIAEVIEFNEETPESHKTWKTKPYDKEKELEEFTDIWFFLAQMVNFKLEISDSFVEIKNEITKLFDDRTNLKLISTKKPSTFFKFGLFCILILFLLLICYLLKIIILKYY